MNRRFKPGCLLLLILLGGCFPRPYQQRKANVFGQLKIGMEQTQVQRLFPKLYPTRQRILPSGGRLEAYRVRKTGWGILFPIPFPMRFDEIDFIFENGRLMEWGEHLPMTPFLMPEQMSPEQSN